ncbi:MAG: hypothetical protein ACM34M_06695 [Ignavibacteria bacterium]
MNGKTIPLDREAITCEMNAITPESHAIGLGSKAIDPESRETKCASGEISSEN